MRGQEASQPMQERDFNEHVKAMSLDELEAIRRDLVTALGFMTPGNGMYVPSQTLLSAVKSELALRAMQEPDRGEARNDGDGRSGYSGGHAGRCA
jgi:hypothetical protein